MLGDQKQRLTQKEEVRGASYKLNKILKQIIQALNSPGTESIANLLKSFCENKPQLSHHEKLSGIILKVKKKRDSHKQTIDSFVYAVKHLEAYCKDIEQASKAIKFSDHIKQIVVSLNKKQIGEWLICIKQKIEKDKITIRQLKEYRYRGSLDEEKKIKGFGSESNYDRVIIKQVVGITGEDGNMGSSLKHENIPKIQQELIKMRQLVDNIAIKIDLLTEKYQLGGGSYPEKLDAVQDYLRSTTLNLHELISQKQRQIENQYNQRLQELKADRDNLQQELSSYRQRLANYGPEKNNSPGQFNGKQQPTFVKVLFKQQAKTVDTHRASSSFLPESDIIQNNHQENSKFLKEKIFRLGKVRPKAAKRIFSSKRQGTDKNIHEYIDNVQNLLLIMKLSNGIIIGGFTHQQFKPECSGRNGFIFSLSKQETFERIVGSTIYYDPSSIIIFGKSELKVKVKEMLLFSNFGSQQRNFDCKKKRVGDFIGCGQAKFAQISVFEIYQVIPV